MDSETILQMVRLIVAGATIAIGSIGPAFAEGRALAQALETLLGQPELAQKMGERGRQRAAQFFDVRLMLQRTKEVYADVLREEIEAGGAPR